jgi:hypothetical protein
MKQIGLLLTALLFVSTAAAKSTKLALNENLEINFDQARSQVLSRNSSYNYSTSSRTESIGLIQKFQLSTHLSTGLGLWLGGLEIELETGPSLVQFQDNQVDLNRWLGVRAKINFADIVPYGNIAYSYQSRDAQLRFGANAGLKLLIPTDVSMSFNGELGSLVNRQADLIAQLEHDVLDQLEDYYLEPVFGVDLSYTFN